MQKLLYNQITFFQEIYKPELQHILQAKKLHCTVKTKRKYWLSALMTVTKTHQFIT